MQENNKIIRIGLVILNYNGAQDTIDCVNSCIHYLTSKNYKLDIYVVDNASSDNSLQQLKNEIPEYIKIIETGRNIGYAAGNNIGIKKAVEAGADYICILNNDTIVCSDFLTPCIETINSSKDIGLVGPAIVNFDSDTVQSTGGFINFKSIKGITRHSNEGLPVKNLKEKYNCDYVEGACIVFQKEILDVVGYIPEAYFLFYEETEWCYQALKNGYKNICLGKVYIKHKGSVSIERVNGLSEYLLCRNQIRFVKRNINNNPTAFCIFIRTCLYTLATVPFRGFHRLQHIRYYLDGWCDSIDARYPFIYITDEKWNSSR